MKQTHFLITALILAAILCTSSAMGDDTILETLVVTARGIEKPVSQTPGGVGTVDEESLFEISPTGAADAMAHIPGVEKSLDSPWGADIAIRGLNRNRVAVLVNGFRVNTATDINGRLGFVNPSDIQRIEVLKGPVSELYGSGTIGGVINIITKKGDFSQSPGWEGSLSGTYVSNPKGADCHGDVTYSSPEQWMYASAGYRDRDSYKAGDGEDIPNSQFRDRSGILDMAKQWNPQNATELQAHFAEARNVGIPGQGTSLPVGPDVTYPRTGSALLSLSHSLSVQGPLLQKSKLDLYYQEIQRRVRIDNFPGGPVQEMAPGADHQTWGLKWFNTLTPGNHTLVTGLDIWQWKIDNTERIRHFVNGQTGVDSSLGNVSQLSAGVFAEDDWPLSDHFTLNIGARFDYIRAKSDDLYNWIIPPSDTVVPALKREGEDQSDPSWSAHAGLTWKIDPVWSMTFLTSSGYRSPDLMDRFKYISLSSGASLYGNPDLDPERSLFFEYGLHAKTPELRFSTSLYANFLKDLITEQIVSDTVLQMENVDEARIMGAEAEAEWFFHPRWSLYGNLAYTCGKNTSEDEYLSSIPPLSGLLGCRYDADDKFWASVETQWAAAQHDVPDNTESSDVWAIVNLRAGYRFPLAQTRHDLMIGINNLFDRDYRNYLSTSRGIELKEPGFALLVNWRMAF